MASTVWKGSISFGLVSVPVKLFTAVRDHDVSFHQYSRETGARIRYKKVDGSTDEVVSSGDIVKGWDAGDERIVIVESNELDQLDPDKSELLDILDFVDLDQIDPVFYDRPYNVVPAGEAAAKAYRLLVEAMVKTHKVAIARFVMRGKEHLAALRPRDGLLVLSTMRFADEVVEPRSADGTKLVDDAEVRDRELAMAEQLIGSLTTEFDPTQYRDEHQERIIAFLEAKAEGETFEAPQPREQGKVIDLIAALEQSLGRRDDEAAASTAPSAEPDAEPEAQTSSGQATQASYDEMSKDELYDLAQTRKIAGRSSMSKSELIEALRNGDQASAA